MGMILGLHSLSDQNIARVLADPPLVWKVVAPEDPEIYEQERSRAKPAGLLSRVFSRPKAASSELDMGPKEGVSTDLDKAWHGIHYMLTGTDWGGEAPLNFLVAGGREVGKIEVGYGPARIFTAKETARIQDAFCRIRDEDLKAKFLPKDMLDKKIYPEIWDRPVEEDDTLGYLLEYAQTLRAFLIQTAGQKLGMVVCIT